MKNCMALTEQELDELIRKYYDGDTSLEEERILQNHFNNASGMSPYVGEWAQFTYFQAKRVEVPAVPLSHRVEQVMAQQDERNKSGGKRLFFRIAALVIFAVGVTWFFITKVAPHTITKESTAELTDFALPDGTHVWLNARSTLKYGSDYNEDDRVVALIGEAYFEVTRHVSKPFIVRTGNATTQVHGTAFNLRRYEKEPTIELAVVHGKVTFGANKKLEVSAGEAAAFNVTEEDVKRCERNPNADAWRTKKLVFKDAAMRDVIRDIERYFHITLRADRPALLDCTLSAEFPDPELNNVLSLVCYSLNIRYSRSDTGIYFLSGQTCQ
jgi:ferric-dicitrate binding protein FerR (iron transport regulator)